MATIYSTIGAPLFVAAVGDIGVSTIVSYGISILLTLAALFYIGVPLLILSILKFKKYPTLTSFEPDVIPAPLTASLDYFEDHQEIVEDLGFEYVTNFFIQDLMPTAKMLGQLWYHTPSCTGLLMTHSYAVNNGEVTLSSQSTEFSTRFSDGTMVDTSNTKDFNSFPNPPGRIRHSIFWERDIRKIYRLHQAICQDVNAAMPVNELDKKFGGDGLAYLTAGIQESNLENVKSGYLRDCSPEYFRATLRGGYLLTWKLLFPVKQFLMLRMKSKVLRKMREFDLRTS